MASSKLTVYKVLLIILQSFRCEIGHCKSLVNESPAFEHCSIRDIPNGLCVPFQHCAKSHSMDWRMPYSLELIEYVKRHYCHFHENQLYGCCAIDEIISSNAIESSEIFSSETNAANASFSSLPIGEQILLALPCGFYKIKKRIGNGELVALGEYPWMALLEYDGVEREKRFLCSGSLITNRYVLTAAHCVESTNQPISVRLGEYNLRTKEDCNYKRCETYEDVGIERIIIHSEYRNSTHGNATFYDDIALIRLNKTIKFQWHIQPICLPPYADFSIPEDFIIIAGWGLTEHGSPSDVLKMAYVKLRNNNFCQNAFNNSLEMTTKHICAGGNNARSTCRGDSGSPLFTAIGRHSYDQRYIQLGIDSAGVYGCGTVPDIPNVFTNVSAYMDWIIDNLEL